MKSLFLSAHNDDEVLFGCFTLLREKPHVVICLRCDYNADPMYGAPHPVREAETAESLRMLEVTWEQWDISETKTFQNPAVIGEELLLRFRALRDSGFTRVWAPMVEAEGGHPHHDLIGKLALSVWPEATRYRTYNLAGKSVGAEVPFHPRWVATKLKAMACYSSQAGGLNSHKYFIRDQREYVAE